MPSGIIMQSASVGATQEAIEKVLEGRGYEVEHPEAPKVEEPVEPQRDAFDNEEEFEAAHLEWQEKQEAPKEEEPEPVPAKKSKFQKRIEKITADLRSQLDASQKRIAELEGKKPEEAKPEENPRPKRDDFKSNEEYEDALLAWGTERALSEKAMREAQESETKRLQTNYDNYRAQVEELKEEHDDWDEVVGQDIPMHTGVQLAIMEQENGARVTYYLGTHPEYADKLFKMSPLSAVMEVGRLSAKLAAESGKPGSTVTRGASTTQPRPKVPAPIRPVSSSATSPSTSARDAAANKDFKAFVAARKAGR